MPVTYLIINDHAMCAIRAASVNEFNQTGTRLPDGNWRVPFNDDTVARMREHAIGTETISDVIIRLIAVTQSGGKLN